ncbi:MAG: SUMF1/EgtB/PvdO family nonheme iron enzyme [bacterium]|nr:SUMF1/EgtB/PvdO family nonheme iron enzyme [bacterium]
MKATILTALAVLMLISVSGVRAETKQVQPGYGTTINWKNVDPPLSSYFSNSWSVGLWTGGRWRGPYVMTKKGAAWNYEQKGVVSIKYTENKKDARRNSLKIKSGVSIPVGVVVSVTDGGDAYIAGGTFQMGNPYSGEGDADEVPTHDVYIRAFSMDTREVTSQQWYAVRNWALAHGYALDNWGAGKAATHPVQAVNWYACVKWCNARSEMQGLTPCYYTDASQSTVYKSGRVDVANSMVKWDANGYRLPTEAEWEKAARGGAVGMRFPWSNANNISNARANYLGDTAIAYDAGPNGNNPLFTPGGIPYTSPVGYFAANGYGLYDMAGNVREWCWDWYGSTYYTSSPGNDPPGPESGESRVMHGGDWNHNAGYSRVANRFGSAPGDAYNHLGFRCVRH